MRWLFGKTDWLGHSSAFSTCRESSHCWVHKITFSTAVSGTWLESRKWRHDRDVDSYLSHVSLVKVNIPEMQSNNNSTSEMRNTPDHSLGIVTWRHCNLVRPFWCHTSPKKKAYSSWKQNWRHILYLINDISSLVHDRLVGDITGTISLKEMGHTKWLNQQMRLRMTSLTVTAARWSWSIHF